MKLHALGAFVAVLANCGLAHATSFAPYRENCVVDANGRYYVVVKRKEDGADYGPVSVTIAECKAGAPPVRSAVAWEGTPFAYSKTIDPSIHVRDGDIIHGRIELRQPPKVILVSSSGKGIVTLDKYGFNALGPTAGIDDVVLHSMDGKVRHRKNRSELFDEKARGGFRHIDGATSWLRACWLDEMRNELVLVAVTRSVKPTTRPLLTMNLTTGAVRAGGTEWIDRAILEHSALSLSEALDLAKELRLAESQAAWPTLLRDDKLSLYVRVQVALLLVSFNDQRGVDVIMNAALDKPGTRDGGAQYLAVTILPEVFGDEAAPNLCEYVRRFGKEDSHPAWSAMRSVPAKAAVPALRRLLDRKEPVHCQLFALECLENKGSAARAAVPDLIRVLKEDERITDHWTKFSTHKHAAKALGSIGSDAAAALPVLIRHAEKRAAAEWARVKNQQPESKPDNSGSVKFSDDPFIEAIVKIRKK